MLEALLEIKQQIRELESAVANMVRLGVINELDYPNKLVKVKLEPELITGWVSWAVRRAHETSEWWSPAVGEQVRLISPGGDLTQGIVDVAINSAAYPAPNDPETMSSVTYADETKISYDADVSKLVAVLVAGGIIEITADGGINIKGSVNIEGSLTTTEEVSDGVGALSRLRDNYNNNKPIGNMGGPIGPPSHLDA